MFFPALPKILRDTSCTGLQHFNECDTGCKPFIDHATYEEEVELQIEN